MVIVISQLILTVCVLVGFSIETLRGSRGRVR